MRKPVPFKNFRIDSRFASQKKGTLSDRQETEKCGPSGSSAVPARHVGSLASHARLAGFYARLRSGGHDHSVRLRFWQQQTADRVVPEATDLEELE